MKILKANITTKLTGLTPYVLSLSKDTTGRVLKGTSIKVKLLHLILLGFPVKRMEVYDNESKY